MSGLLQKLTAGKNWFFALSWKKKIFFILILGILIFLASAPLRTKKPQYTTVKASKTDIVEVVTETGNIAASGRIDVYSPTNGVVTSVSVKNGDVIEKNQELFTVVSSATEQEKAAALSSLLLAQSNLGEAKSTMYSLQSAKDSAWKTFYDIATNSTYQNSDGSPNTSNRALTEFSTAQSDWLAAEAQYKNQQAVVNQASAELGNASLKYDATQNATVKSQNSGMVSNLSVDVGDSVSAKSPTTPTVPALTIANFSSTIVVVELGEADIAKVKEGQVASVKVASVSDNPYKGVVKRVDSIANDNQGVLKYAVYIDLLNPDGNLRPGMTADATITTKKIGNVLTVPNSAVKPYQGGRAVRVPGKNGKIDYAPVKIGIRGETMTQIISGISEGQEVITSLSNEALQRPGLFGN